VVALCFVLVSSSDLSLAVLFCIDRRWSVQLISARDWLYGLPQSAEESILSVSTSTAKGAVYQRWTMRVRHNQNAMWNAFMSKRSNYCHISRLSKKGSRLAGRSRRKLSLRILQEARRFSELKFMGMSMHVKVGRMVRRKSKSPWRPSCPLGTITC
jgi:hypothetical protein